MEAFRHAHGPHTRTSHLTKLYSDAKKSALTSLQVQPTTDAQSASLQRKYRIQKDRLITWGLEWTDGEKGPDGDIDESVAKAGLTETVESVLRNIQEVTEEAERIKWASSPMTKPGEAYPQKLATFDNERYEDLLRDLTASIDTLYDLSISRRALARGEHPTFEDPLTEAPPEIPPEYPAEKPSSGKRKMVPVYRPSSDTKADLPTITKQQISPYAGIPAQIDMSALRLPNESLPPYQAHGIPSSTRMIAKLDRRKAPVVIQNALGSPAAEVPVLIEYANFDKTWRETGVPPPLQRLEALATVFQPMRAESQTNLSLLGYFEHPTQLRIGLVYDLPYAIQNKLQIEAQSEPLTPVSLLQTLQKTNKAQGQGQDAPRPALEHVFRMALRLTEHLHALHSERFTHGNINSSSVIFTAAANDSENEKIEQLRKPLWSSFDLFSKTNIEGVMQPPDFNIYRHPKDLPFQSDRDFPTDLKYDLYGLGLVLLEVGLWTPLGDLYKSRYSLEDFKLRLEKIWIPKLGAKCGSAYMRAVETCLRLSDDPDNSRLTVEGIYGILLQFLKRCCLLDDVGSSTELIPASELISAPTSPAPSSAQPRRPQRHASEASSIARQQTDPDLLRTQSATSLTPIPQRFDSLSNLARVASPTAQQEHALLQEYETHSQVSPSPSLRDFKRRIRLIQQKWRERRAMKSERQRTRGLEDTQEQLSKPKREEYPDIKLPQEILDHWQNTLSFQLQALVERALRGSPESSSIRLLPYGESPETAKPTLIVGCTSTAKVKHILKRHFKYDSNVYDVRVKKEVIRRCRGSRKHRTSDATRSMAPARDFLEDKAINPGYQDRPLCGASIGAYRYDEHLPPASFGGVVLVDGHPYGMSVHHMLEPEEEADDEEEDEQDDDDKSDTSSLHSSDSDPLSEEEDQETIRPPSTHSSEEATLPTEDSTGDCPGIVPGDLEEVAITQPALDDAIDCDLHAEESSSDNDDGSDDGIDEDHLLSFKLGQVHVSSGLKRTKKTHEGGFKSISQSLPQEIDWALFELVPPRMYPFNIIRGGGKYCKTSVDRKGNSVPTSVKSSTDIACAKVHCLGRTSGLGHGTVSSTMELVKIHGRSTFSASWSIVGNFGTGGDSGAWVISNEDGKVCGHVLASKTGRTYICPMDLLLEDIRATLGAVEVTLPMVVGKNESRPSSSKSEEKAVADAIGKMRLQEGESGGVKLPVSPAKARTVEPVG